MQPCEFDDLVVVHVLVIREATIRRREAYRFCRRDEPGREGTLLALAALSAFGCGLALAHADFLFAAIFAAASAAVVVEALRRFR
jgi:hypothetical protein